MWNVWVSLEQLATASGLGCLDSGSATSAISDPEEVAFPK